MSIDTVPADDTLDWLDPGEDGTWSPRVVAAEIIAANADVAAAKFVDEFGASRTGRLALSDFSGKTRWTVGGSLVVLQCDDSSRPTLSTADSRLPAALLDGVSPEVRSGAVRVMAVARRAGSRTKVAVATTVPGVDPVAACVGRAHNRVDVLRATLGSEQVDVVAWHPEPAQFLVNAMQPASISAVWIDLVKKVALVVAPDHQMSSAVGGGGLNSLLAGQLVGVAVRVIPASKAQAVTDRLGPPQFPPPAKVENITEENDEKDPAVEQKADM